MKRKKSLVLLALAFTLTLLPAVLAQPMKPLTCNFEMELEMGVGWDGEISGDINGDFFIYPQGAVFPGITEHYWEEWVVTTADGTITIWQEGVWSFKSFKFKSNGYVSDATGPYEYLIGARVHVRGVTSPFPGSDPVTGEGKLWICGYSS